MFGEKLSSISLAGNDLNDSGGETCFDGETGEEESLEDVKVRKINSSPSSVGKIS